MSSFSWSPRRLSRPLGVLRRYGRRARPALDSWFSTTGNPFLTRARRVEGRAHKPLLTLGAIAIAIGLAMWGAWWLWTNFGIEATRTPAPDILPRALGSHPIGFLAALTLTVSLLGALGATRARASALLRRELLGNTLDSLQMLPTGEERWVWWMSAQPFLLSLLIGTVGLPIYVLAVWSGVWRPLDLLGIALLFGVVGLVVPTWQPQQWQQQAARKAGKKIGAVTTPRRGGKAAPLTRQSTLRPAADASSAPEAPVPADEVRIEALKGEAAKSSGGFRSGGGWTWFYIWLFIQGFGGSLRWLMRGNNGLSLFWHNISAALPSSVTDLIGRGPAVLLHLALNWPLIVERTLLSSLPFFARSLPPLLLLLPFLLALRHQQTVTLASNVSGGESFWNARRVRRKREIGAALWSAFVLIFFGFGWQTLVPDGMLHVALRGAPWGLSPAADWSLAALWTLCIVVATLLAASALEAPVRGATMRERLADQMEIGTLPQFWRLMLISTARLMIGGVVVYFAMCWMGGTSGLNAAWRSRLALTLATAGAFLLADMGSGALQTAVAPDLRPTIRVARVLWFWGLAALVPLLLLVDNFRGLEFSFAQLPLVGLSPAVSLLGLLRYQISFPGGPWWPLIVQAVIGAMCMGIAHALEERQRAAQPIAAPMEAAPEVEPRGVAERLLWILWWPFRMIGTIFRWLFGGVLWLYVAFIKGVRRINDGLTAPLARWNNPVLSDELKRRLNREWWVVQWLAIGVGALLFFALVTTPWTWLVTGVSLSGAVVVGVAGGCAIFSSLVGLTLGRSLDRERSNGTLIFLFLTPLTEREILLGKLLPALLYGVALLGIALPWLVLGVAADTFNGVTSTLLMAAGLLAMAVVQWLFTSAVAILCAVRARRPNDGIAYTFLSVLLIEGGLWAALAYLLDRWMGLSNVSPSTIAFIVACLLLIIAFGAWRAALYSLRRLRYNDQTQRGKGAS